MTWSYLAGFVDGEGSICLSRGGSYRYKNVPRVPTYRPTLSIANNHRGVLELTVEFIGHGSVNHHPRNNPNQKQGYMYQASGFRIEHTLRRLLPHLMVKRSQAELAISFIERRKRERTRPFTHEDYAFVEEMQRLNDRAPGKGSPIRPLPKPRTRARYRSIAPEIP